MSEVPVKPVTLTAAERALLLALLPCQLRVYRASAMPRSHDSLADQRWRAEAEARAVIVEGLIAKLREADG